MVAPFQNSRGEPPTCRHTSDARLQADWIFPAWGMHLTATGSCCPSLPTHLLQDVLQTSSFLSQASLLPCPRSLRGAHGAPGCPGQPCCPHHNMTRPGGRQGLSREEMCFGPQVETGAHSLCSNEREVMPGTPFLPNP